MPDNDKIQLPKGFKLDESVETPNVKLPKGFTLDTEVVKKKVGGEESSLTKSPSISQEYLREGQGLADKGFIKTEKLNPSQLVSQYRSPDISLTPKPKKNYYSDKLEKGLIFDKEGKLYEPSSEVLTKAITPAEQIDLKKPTQKDLVEKSREMPVEEETAPIEKQGWLLNMVSALDKGFAKNFISSPIKGLGTVLQGATKKVMGGTGEGFVSDNLIKFGDYLNNAIDELTPQDEEFKNTLWDQAAQALGQVTSLVFTGGISGAAGKGAALVSQAPKGAVAAATKALGSQLSSPTAVSAGLSMGQAEFDRAKEAGATDDQAFEAFYKNAVTGSVLETIPVMQFFKRFNNSTGGSVANYIKTKGVAGLTGGIEEMTTEVMQQLYSNKTAKDIYNINQDILDGIGSSGGVGFGVGFLLNAMGANAKILRKQGRVKEADALENQVKQYEDNLENPKVTSDKKAVTKDIVTQGVEIGTKKAVQSLDRDLANNVITPEQYQESVVFAEKAAQVADKIPETVTGESRAKSIELLVERNDINQANQNLLQQKQTTDVAYHAGIDEEIKANEERIKKLDSEVYNIAKKPSKEFGNKKYIVDGEEVTKEAFEALQGKPLGTKTVIKAEVKPEEVEVTEEVKPTEDVYFNKLHKSEKFDDNSSVSTYLGDDKGEKNIFYTLPNKGVISFKEIKNNTNRFSLTANAKNDKPLDIKNAFKRIEKFLPANHELIEDKSISVDGLRVWNNFIKNDKYIKTGETKEVEITPIDKTNLFKDLKYNTEGKWNGAKFENKDEALARLEKYIKNNNLNFKVKIDGDFIKVEVPVLKYNPSKEVKPTEVKKVAKSTELEYQKADIEKTREKELDKLGLKPLNLKNLNKKDYKAVLDDWASKENAINEKYDYELYKIDNPETRVTLENGVKKYFVNDKQVTKEELEKAAGFDAEDHFVEKVGKQIEKEIKTYNAKDLKENNDVLKEDEFIYTGGTPKSFVTLFTDMFSMKNNGYENAKVGDVINIFKKDYVVGGFIENKKSPDKTSVKLIRIDKDNNLLREQDLSKKEQKEGKAKEFEEEEEVEVEEAEELTKDDLKKAEAKFTAAEDRFKKARNKIEATQVKQAGMFGGEQKGMFAMGGAEAKSTLDPLRKAAKEAKAELDDIRNRIKVQEVAQPELAPVESKSDEDFVDKKIKLIKEQGKPLSEFKVGDKVFWASDWDKRWKQYSEGTIVKTGNDYEIKRFSEHPTSKNYKTFVLSSNTDVMLKPENEAKYTGEEAISKATKAFTTKNGRQKIEYEKGQLIVRDTKTGKEVSDATRKKAIDEYIDNFDFNKGERFTEVVSEMPSGLNEEEGKRFIIENTNNPLEVLETYAAEPKESKLTTEEQLIADYGLGKLTQKGFKRFGDENLITGGMALTYFNKEGTPIDVRAKEMSDYYGKEITPQDIVNFMIAYPSGASQAVRMGETRVAREAAEKFKELTGIDLNIKNAEKIIDAEIAKAESFEQELIKQEYETREQLEAEYYKASAEADRLAEEGNRPATKESEKTKETELAKEYKEVVGKASKKAKENAKKDFVDRNFDNIVEKLKIQIKCPT